MEIVISQGGINGNSMFLPSRGFRVPNLPVLRIVAGIDNIATDGDEGWFVFVNGLHQSLPDNCIRYFRVRGIVKSGIPKRNESKRSGDTQRKCLVI